MLAEGFPPSDFIKEELEARGWSVEALAEQMGVTRTYLDPVLSGHRRVTKGCAYFLGKAFGTSAELWLNLQAGWDEWQKQRS